MKRISILALIPLTGCGMGFWGGQMADRSPGVHAEGGGLFSPPSIDVTSDCNAEIESLTYTRGTATQPSTFAMQGAKFGQKPSIDLPFIPAILDKLPAIQDSQSRYAQVWANVATEAIDTAGAVINVLSAARIKSTSQGVQLTLPGGLTIGGNKVTNPGDITAYLQALQGQLKTIRDKAPVVTQPSN